MTSEEADDLAAYLGKLFPLADPERIGACRDVLAAFPDAAACRAAVAFHRASREHLCEPELYASIRRELDRDGSGRVGAAVAAAAGASRREEAIRLAVEADRARVVGALAVMGACEIERRKAEVVSAYREGGAAEWFVAKLAAADPRANPVLGAMIVSGFGVQALAAELEGE